MSYPYTVIQASTWLVQYSALGLCELDKNKIETNYIFCIVWFQDCNLVNLKVKKSYILNAEVKIFCFMYVFFQ